MTANREVRATQPLIKDRGLQKTWCQITQSFVELAQL